jgi:hypothetical protein
MSKHYILHLSAELITPVDPHAEAVLRYLISGMGPAPQAWPAHQFFLMERVSMELRPLPRGFTNFKAGDFVCEYWADEVGPRSGVTLRLPGIKDLQGWFEALTFADWLCSLTGSDACIGYIQDEEDRCALSLLYALGGALYFRAENIESAELVRLTTGEVWAGHRG